MKRQYGVPIGAMVVIALVAALALSAPWGQGALAQGDTIYVDADATGVPDGSSWGTAFTTLQPALNAADTGDEIWVAEGTYTPTAEHGGTGDRYRSFQMANGVEIYGGFDPSVGATGWGDRDWEAYPTILSGDLAGDDEPGFVNNEENSYHVFYHPEGTNLDSSAILDGFIIAAGNASGETYHTLGGGMYNHGSSPSLANCIFDDNRAGGWSGGGGGGMYNSNGSSPTLTDCTFSGNRAGTDGGGMYNVNSSPELFGCTFSGNAAIEGSGGGMYNTASSSPMLDDCTFANNYGFAYGGGIHNASSSPVLTDCTFEGNRSDTNGGGLANVSGSSPELIGCTFSNNSADIGNGGGIYNSSSSPVLRKCLFLGNSADYGGTGQGGGMYNSGASSPTLADCTFTGNTADSGAGMGNNASSPMLTNCTFAGNLAVVNGGAMVNASDSLPELTNCTFVDNSAGMGGGGMINWSSSPVLTNCIFWGNAPDQITSDGTSSPVVTYCDVEGGYPGETNIDEDPLFVNAPGGDYHLGAGSPCIDAGTNDAPDLPPYDFEGDDRVLDGDGDGTATVDMGVDEAQEQGPPPDVIYVDQDAGGANDGTSWADAFTTLQPALDWAEEGVEIWVAEGTYTPTAEHGGTGDRYKSFQMANGVEIYGGFDPSVGATGWGDRDWEAHTTILSGDLAGDDEPGFVNNEENSYHVFYHPGGTALDGTAILDGFTISGGNANGEMSHAFAGGMYNNASSPALTNCTLSANSGLAGGGMYNTNSSPTLTNCTFAGNSGNYGGGIQNNTNGSPTLTNCTFSANMASYGGGIYNYSSTPVLINTTFLGNSAVNNGGGMWNYEASPTLTGCTFSGNSASYGGGIGNTYSTPTLNNTIFTGNSVTNNGGGMSNGGSSPTLTNCTFSGNSANSGGGMYNSSSSPVLTNCILWGDTSPEIVDYDSTSDVTYSNVQGGQLGEGNIDAYPWFADAASGDFHLGPCSQCIDAGNDGAPNLPDYDFDGDDRILDGNGDAIAAVDMGVDEVAVPGTCSHVYLPVVLREY